MDSAMLALLVYVGGVAWGLLRTDASPLVRLGYAIAWPVGPAAFLLTVAGLLLIAPVALIGRR
jgi:hypothetical protein